MNQSRKWILLRGLIRWKDHWLDFIPKFQKAFPEDELILLDLPGFGDENQNSGYWKMEEVLDHLDQKLDLSKGPYHLFAVSLGAMVAAHWAARRPESFRQLVLLNTSDRRSPIYDRFQVAAWGPLLRDFLFFDSHTIEADVLALTSNLQERRIYALPKFLSIHQKSPFDRTRFFKQIFLGSQARFPDQAPVPTLFMNSRKDRLVSERCTARLAKLWQSPLITHNEAGHDLTLDAGPWVLKKMQEHLYNRF